MEAEKLVRIEAIRNPRFRASNGSCMKLAASIRDDGLRHPVTVWKDGTLISGARRLTAHLLLQQHRIPAVFVGTIEDAAKQMLADNADPWLPLPWKWSEVCHLWTELRRLDEPAAAGRNDAARRRGVELRKQTQAGTRAPGRAHNRSDDYVLGVISEPFGISGATARRIEAIYTLGSDAAPAATRDLARQLMAEIDAGATIWSRYQILTGSKPHVTKPRPIVPVVSAGSARQVSAWERSLPQMEGLVAGLAELGPPNTGLTWDEVGPACTRLVAVRRDLEKIIKQMRETKP